VGDSDHSYAHEEKGMLESDQSDRGDKVRGSHKDTERNKRKNRRDGQVVDQMPTTTTKSRKS
jgi:hypothetical protein